MRRNKLQVPQRKKDLGILYKRYILLNRNASAPSTPFTPSARLHPGNPEEVAVFVLAVGR